MLHSCFNKHPVNVTDRCVLVSIPNTIFLKLAHRIVYFFRFKLQCKNTSTSLLLRTGYYLCNNVSFYTLFLFDAVCCFWKRRGGGRNTNVCWHHRKDEEIPSVFPLITIHRDDVPPYRDDVPPQRDAVPPQCDPTKGPCDCRHPMAFSGNDKNCVV